MAKKSTRRLEVWCNDAVCVYEFPPHLCEVLDPHNVSDEEVAETFVENLTAATAEILKEFQPGGDKPHHGDI